MAPGIERWLARGGRRLSSLPKPTFSTVRMIRPDVHVDAFLRRADSSRLAARARSSPLEQSPALASQLYMREYALFQRAFIELEDRLGDSFAPSSVLVADLPGSHAAALLAAHDKFGGGDGGEGAHSAFGDTTLCKLSSPNKEALDALRELCPERMMELTLVDAAQGAVPNARYDLICAAFDSEHHRGGLVRTAPLAESVLAMSNLLNPGGVLVIVEPLGAEHLGELFLEPKLVPAARALAADVIAAGGRLSVVAPCMHSHACPLIAEPLAFNAKRQRHCTFAQRFERRRTQRLGRLRTDLNFGTTHFAYLCLQKTAARLPPRAANVVALGEGEEEIVGRIMTPPRKRSGHVLLDLCTSRGIFRTLTVSRRKHGNADDGKDDDADDGGDGGELSPYRAARVSTWGDPWRVGVVPLKQPGAAAGDESN
jgi:ribosomal protein RSM22 (predicted rRNA methylase)